MYNLMMSRFNAHPPNAVQFLNCIKSFQHYEIAIRICDQLNMITPPTRHMLLYFTDEDGYDVIVLDSQRA